VDWELPPHLGLRVQYRGNVNRAPEVVQFFTTTHTFLQSAKPMVGLFSLLKTTRRRGLSLRG
jgi:hypothetical protein